jgi:peptidoglycan/LPS O-acetylase OafA/YrhL
MGTTESQSSRLGYVDNLRVALTALVVVHHAGQAYGTGGFWQYQEPADNRTYLLGSFLTVNAAYFMGLYFLISALFSPKSFDRKGPAAFVKERLVRLGIPLAFFFLTVIPVLMYVYYLNFRPYGPIGFWEYYWRVYFGGGPRPADWSGPSWPDLQFAHLWFVEHLLCYSVLYAGWRLLPESPRRRCVAAFPDEIRHWHLVAYALALAAATFAVRVWYPIDHWVGMLGFIQSELAHLPQYASLYVLGLVAARKGWLESLPSSLGRDWLAVGLALAGFAALLMVPGCEGLGKYFAGGGLSGYAAVRATWEAFLCVGMCVGLLVLFRDRVRGQTRLLKSLAADTYGVYLFHYPVVVALNFALAPAPLSGLAKFFLVSIAALLLTTALAELLRRLPGLRRIL